MLIRRRVQGHVIATEPVPAALTRPDRQVYSENASEYDQAVTCGLRTCREILNKPRWRWGERMPKRRIITALLASLVILPVAAGTKMATGATVPGTSATSTVKSPIKHVVILYLENHSFDNLLGYWCDNHPRRCPKGGMPSSVTLSNGAVVTPSIDPDVVPEVAHNVNSQLAAMNIQGGKPQMNGWQDINGATGTCDAATGYACVSGYKPRQEPNLITLAEKFAISDATFSLADSPSYGGHLDIVTSNLDGFTGDIPKPAPGVTPGQIWGCDSNEVAPWEAQLGGPIQQVPSCIPDPSLMHNDAPLPNGGAFEPTPVPYEPTIMDELQAAGLSWKFYTASCTDEIIASDGLETCEKNNGGYSWSPCAAIAECLYRDSSDIALPDIFLSDAATGNLPTFSVITPSGSYVLDSEHNGFSLTAGDDFIGKMASAVMKSPEWDSTALFISWDDCGCFYDQVPPGVNPDGTLRGPRVPLIIVSPFVKPGYTDSTATTYAGILGYVEKNFHLAPLGVNDAGAYSFAQAFSYSQPPLRPVPMIHRRVPSTDHIDRSQANQDT